jgi:hypothetical protein
MLFGERTIESARVFLRETAQRNGVGWPSQIGSSASDALGVPLGNSRRAWGLATRAR